MNEEQKRGEARKEAAKAKGHEPFRFWTPVGETRQLVIIDDKPDFFRYEHALKDNRSGRFDNFLPCINEDANCPVCANSDKPSYFAMYLTVLDLTPYENKDGVEVPWSKKILVVKPAQQKKIARLYEKEGSLRGMILDMTRDGAKDASIGNDIEFVDFMDEKELEEFYDTYKDKDGKTVEIIGSEPFDYDEIYPEMTEKQLMTLAGVSDNGSVGRRSDDDRAIGRRSSRRDEEEEEAPRSRGRGRRADAADDEEPPARGRRSSRRDEEEEEAPRSRGRGRARDEEEEEAPPARGRGRQSREEEEEEAPPARSVRGRARAQEPEEEEEEAPRSRGRGHPSRDEEEEEAPPARGRGRSRAEPEDEGEEEPPARSRGRGRARAEEAEEEADAPQRSRASRGRGRADADDAEPPFEEEEAPAARRSALRNRRS